MTYKQEFQNKNAEKLHQKFEENNIPEFIRGYFFTLKSDYNRVITFYKLNKFFVWLIEKKYVSSETISQLSIIDFKELKMNHVVEYLEALRTGADGLKILSVNTIYSVKNCLSSFWAYLVNMDYVEKNIVKNISNSSYRPEHTNEIVVLSDEDIDELLENIRISGHRKNEFVVERNVAIVRLLLGSGIRVSELVGLDMDDMFLNENFPYIYVTLKGRSEKKKRVYINQAAKDALLTYISYRSKMEGVKECDAVFVSNRRKRISKANVEDMIKRYSNGKFTPHNMRDTVGTRIYEKQKDIKAAQEQLNHASPSTTSKYYIAYEEKKSAEIINSI